MKRMIPFIIIGLIFYCVVSWGQDIYQWVDEKGILHFTDDLSMVPERYLNQVQKKNIPGESSPLLPPQKDTQDKTKEVPNLAPERKDLLGRGEEWWRTRAKELNEKLLNANQNYDTAYAAWKAKEKELEESKYKVKSLRRKLKAENKLLEDKVKELERQKEEARNMLEKVLPKEAEQFNADPDWIKLEE
jgi:hypothetical protein